jgi:prepilin-type N-terminal cleavage/methylation domain-containing protein
MRQIRSQTAFTLIELLIVLAIAGSVSAFVAPELWRTLQRTGERETVRAWGNEILDQRRDLYRQGRSLVVAENQLVNAPGVSGLPPIPSGWLVTRQSALRFLPTGVTRGGTLIFEAPSGREWRLQFAVLDGRMTVSSL